MKTSECDNCLLVIAGDGPVTESLRTAVTDNGLESKVIFIGQLAESQKPCFYMASDIFASPNVDINGDAEGFGIVFLEAASFGLPIIYGRSGGAGEAAKGDYNAISVDGSDVNEIALAILRYKCSPELRQFHAANGKVWVRKFDWVKQTEQLVLLLKKAQ
jgi:phosphatidylinositol alpha-1,6-mannosyltransferase